MNDLASSTSTSIEIVGLKKAFGHQWALRGLDIRIVRGEFVTIFGPNGAGKTTLIRVLAHLVRPTAGKVTILGIPLEKAEHDIRARIGVISHHSFLYRNLTGRENLRFFGRVFDVVDLEERIRKLLDEMELSARADSQVSTYSKGMTQRLAIARAILHKPDIILLDEPFSGLDQRAADLLTQLLRRLHAGNRTLLMTTHNLEQGLELSQRLAIQVGGRIVYQTTCDGLTPHSLRQTYLELTTPHCQAEQGGPAG